MKSKIINSFPKINYNEVKSVIIKPLKSALNSFVNFLTNLLNS